MVSILVGLVIKKTPVIGIVFIPVLEQMYTAIRGRGAFMNGKKLRVRIYTKLISSSSSESTFKCLNLITCGNE